MPEAPGTSSWRHYTIGSPILACLLVRDDLKRLFDIIDEKRKEEAQQILTALTKLPTEDDDQFEARKKRVRDALVTLVSITAPDGEMVTGNTRDFFDSVAIPERVQSVVIDTSNAPKAALNFAPTNNVSVFLDFSRPPLLNFGVIASAPTPNASNYKIVASAEPWATSLNARLHGFFSERKTACGWLHKSGCYDALLIFFGVPLALWASYRVGAEFVAPTMPNVLVTAIYVYLFFLLLNLFRALFSYTRWVFPLVELRSPRATWSQRHRVFWAAVMLGVVGSFVWDAVKFLASR